MFALLLEDVYIPRKFVHVMLSYGVFTSKRMDGEVVYRTIGVEAT